MRLNLIGTGNEGRSKSACAQRRINYYLEKSPDKGAISAYPVAGFNRVTQIGSLQLAPILSGRELLAVYHWSYFNVLVLVFPDRIQAISATGQTSFISLPAGILQTSARILFAESDAGQLLVAWNNFIVGLRDTAPVPVVGLLGTLGLDQINAPDDLLTNINITGLGYLGGRFITLSNGVLYFTEIDETDFPALNKFRPAKNDIAQAFVIYKGNLVVFHRTTISFFGLSENPDRPYQEIPSTTQHVGIYGPRTIQEIAGVLYFRGIDNAGTVRVYRLAGYTVEPISDAQIDNRLMAVLPSPDVLQATTYAAHGHAFYRLSSTRQCLVYDVTSGAWHEEYRGTFIESADPHPAFYGTFARSFEWRFRQFFISRAEGFTSQLFELSEFEDTHAGADLTRQIISPHFYDEATGNFLTCQRVRIEVSENAAALRLLISRDRGETWGPPTVAPTTAGNIVEWRGLGHARCFTFRLETSNANPPAILEAYADFAFTEGGTRPKVSNA